MMIESMAGKAAAMHGHAYDATPFSFSEDNTAIEHFGELLTRGAHAGVAPGAFASSCLNVVVVWVLVTCSPLCPVSGICWMALLS